LPKQFNKKKKKIKESEKKNPGGVGRREPKRPCGVRPLVQPQRNTIIKKIFKFNTNFIQRKCEKILPYAKSNYASQIRPARLFFFF
jgi:hypothetical protein